MQIRLGKTVEIGEAERKALFVRITNERDFDTMADRDMIQEFFTQLVEDTIAQAMDEYVEYKAVYDKRMQEG